MISGPPQTLLMLSTSLLCITATFLTLYCTYSCCIMQGRNLCRFRWPIQCMAFVLVTLVILYFNRFNRYQDDASMQLKMFQPSPLDHQNHTSTRWEAVLRRAKFVDWNMSADRLRASLLKPVVISVIPSSLVEGLSAPTPPPAPHSKPNDFRLQEGFVKRRGWGSGTDDPCFIKLTSPKDLFVELNCTLLDDRNQRSHARSDGLWYDLTSIERPSQIRRWANGQAVIGFTQESPANYPNLVNPSILPLLDLMVSHELSADVVAHYYWDRPAFHQPPQRLHSRRKGTQSVS